MWWCGGGRAWDRQDHDDLTLSDKGFMAIILDVLKDAPGNGYDVVKGLEERLGDVHTVSPGNVYPVLQLLEDAGYVKAEAPDGRKSFTVTDEGRAYLAERQEALESFWARVERGKYKQAVWEAIGDLKGLAWEVRSTVAERRLDREQLTAIQAAIANAREVIEKNLAG
ncbi:MAG: transcriptional regulator, PadR family [Cyanobacteria bacterium RYN_339]|nr:transcriptional regulator, PadR family [Cyanobacteria bacterium RYN_339]